MAKEIQILNNGESLHSIRTKINENFVGLNEAENIQYDASKTGIVSDNVQGAIDSLGRRINGLNRFCVNEGNLTNDDADLLSYSGAIISYKVGNTYPNLVATKADGTTFTRSSISNSSATGLANGVYNIFIDETGTELLSNNILSEGQESIAVNNDVLYDSVNKTAKKYLTGGLQYNRKNITTGNACYGIASNDNTKVVCGNMGTIFSTTDGTTWAKRTSNITYNLNDVTWTGSAFIAVGNNTAIARSTDGITWTRITQTEITTSQHYRSVASNGQTVVACGDNLLTAYSLDGGVSWTSSVSSDYTVYTSVAYGNGRFIMVGNNGSVKISTDGRTWEGNLTYAVNFIRIRYIEDRFFALTSDGRVFYSTDGNGWGSWDTNLGVHLNDIAKFNNYYVILTNSGNIFYSPDYSSTPVQMSTESESSFRGIDNKGAVISVNGNLYELKPGGSWAIYSKVPLGSVTVSSGTVTAIQTFPYNYTPYNGLLATTATYGLLRTAAVEDEIDCSCNDASITPSNLYDLANYRRVNTEYNVDDKVGCPYHHNLQLKCTQAGTTSNEALDTKGALEAGDIIEDGSVIWEVEELGTGSGSSGFNLFDTKTSDHILEGEEALGWALQGTYVYKEGVSGSRTGYADFYNKCLAEKELGTATETTLGDNTITMYVNANGHTFYDIANKDVVDTFYNAIGTAWFYGIDTENERIFLPRNDHFVQLTGDTSKVNEYVEAGLPNIEGYLKVASNAFATEISGAFARTTTGTCHVLNQGTVSANNGVYFDASASNDIYGKSDTVQPNAIKQLLYICVGNTKVESAISDVTQITTSENDTLPLFHNFYSKEDMTTTGAYVNASLGSWLSGNVYTTAYNELVNKLGTGNVKANTDEYTDYDFVINQDDMTFRLPLLNGSEDLPDYSNGQTIDSGFVAPCNGRVILQNAALSSAQAYLYVNGVEVGFASGGTTIQDPHTLSTDVVKGDVVTFTNMSGNHRKFHKKVGNGNLYYKLSNAVTNLELLDVAKVMNEAVLKSSLVEANVIVESYVNGTSGYNVYSNGYCEQWGVYQFTGTHGTQYTINLLKEMKNSDYITLRGGAFAIGTTSLIAISEISKATNSFVIQYGSQTGGSYAVTYNWKACGYIK